MFATSSARQTQSKSRPLQLESLESRQMMIATHLVLDFTPDYRGGSFWNTFQNSRYSNGTAPAFLDFNGDRKITTQDAEIAAGQIRDVVGSFFAGPARGYNVGLAYGDVLTQTNYGYNYLVYGQKSTDQVLVMYVGGKDVGEIGRAPVAGDGYNVEGYGNTYTQAIATMLMNRAGSTKEAFVWAVANTAAHEFGHMLGLRHSLGGYSNDVMSATQSYTPWKDVFSAVNQRTEGGAGQNAVYELQKSFAGQPTYFGGVNNGSAQMGSDALLGDDDHDHDLGDDDCGLDLDAILAGITFDGDGTQDVIPADFSESLAELLAGGTAALTSVKSSAVQFVAGPVVATNNGDLLTLLAIDLTRSKNGSEVGSSATAKSTSVQSLDELFTDFGLVTAK